ncbi:GRF zinc finger / Zinc knuckle protein [Hirschfeldia incana]|nr:GRF zinc finger / Zinc knuckle protein [Hirschfeldia incana]
MPTGNCFHCHKPGHWANRCPLKSTTTNTTTDPAASPPVIHCYCDRACNVLTSKTVNNPNRKFYKCSAVPNCKFFKWCDEVSIDSLPEVSLNPTCPCGSGPCRKLTFTGGPNANRSYFVCCIKKGFGACGFFQWENDAQIQSEQVVGLSGSRCTSALSDFSEFNNSLPNIDLNSDASVNQESKDVVPSLAPKHNETQVKDLCNYDTTDSYALEVAEATSLSENIINPVSSKQSSQCTTYVETEPSSSSSLMDLIEQYNSEKLHFESVSMKHLDVLSAFTGSYKILESLRDTARSLSMPLTEVEKQVKIYEAKTSELAANLEEVCGEMTKSQNKMVETARRLMKELSGKMKGARK